MQISPVNTCPKYTLSDCASRKPKFGHEHTFADKNGYKFSDKAIIAGCSILGVLGSLALLAKGAGYSLKPSKMFKNIKNSYVAKTDYFAKEVITLGAGSCIGGLTGGFIVDKDKNNRKAKVRESLMQIGNVSIPILTVDLLVDRLFQKSSDVTKAFAGLGGVAIGVVLANFIMNKINNLIFKEKTGTVRKVKITDFSAHLDDVVVAANYIPQKSKIVHAIGRIIPAALVIPGLEVGNKKAM